MATGLTLASPVGFCNGEEQSGGPFLGFQYSDGDRNYVLRYGFRTPTGGTLTGLTLTTTLRWYSGDTGYLRPIRMKVTTDADSHVAAGAGDSYDAEYSYSVTTADTAVSISITGLTLPPDTTCYLYLFPGSGFVNDGSAKNGQFLLYCYDNSGADLATLEATIQPGGRVYIDTGSKWEAFEVYIDSGTQWQKYIPYIDSGTEWEMCS